MTRHIIDDLVERIRREHMAFCPAPPNDVERATALGLPADVLRFYQLTNGALLHSSQYGTFPGPDARRWNWRIVPIRELVTVQEHGYIPRDSSIYEIAGDWLVLIDVQDGDVLALNLAPGHIGEIIDCFHETVGDPGSNAVVARTFAEVLELLLKSRAPFWLESDRQPFGAY